MTKHHRVNLIPLERRRDRERRAHLRLWIAASSAYALVLLAAFVATRATAAGADDGREAELARLAQEADRIRRDEAEASAALARVTSDLEASVAVGSQPDWSVLLAVVAEAMGEEIVLQQCRLGSEAATAPTRPRRPGAPGIDAVPASGASALGRHLDLAGLGLSQQAVADFVLRLDATGLFESVKLGGTQRESFLDEHAMSFRIACEIAVGEPPAQREPSAPREEATP